MKEEEMQVRLCSEPEIPERILPPDLDPDRARLINALGKKWVNGTVLHYCFLNQPQNFVGEDNQKNIVRKGFDVWKNVGIGVKFEEVSNPEDAQVRIAFLRDDGAWSYVGRDILDEEHHRDNRTMNFGWDLVAGDPRGIDTATHEIGHTLGFPHEHQNPNSGIEWNEPAVYDWARRTQGWDRNKTFWNIIRHITPDEVEGSGWDPDSVMHYPFIAGLILKPEKYRTVPLRPAGGLSDRDKTWAETFYPPLAEQDVSQLKLNVPAPLTLEPGEQKDFTFIPPETRTYDIQTSGESDTVMVLFEEKDGQRRQIAANDDSAEDFNAHIQEELAKDGRYVLSIRMYYNWQPGDTSVKVW